MIYEMVFSRVNDLQTAWQDLHNGAQALATALVNNPAQASFNNWATEINTLITGPRGLIQTQIPTLEIQRGQGAQGIPGLLAITQSILVGTNTGLATVIAMSAQQALPTLLISQNGQVQATARIVQGQLDHLRQIIARGLQEIVDVATAQGGLANLAGIRSSVDDISTYPVLTQELGYTEAPSFPSPSAPSAAPLSQTVQRALIEVLGRRPRLSDTKSFVAALKQSFTSEEVDGYTVYKWIPHGAIGQTDLGATLTGAQASLYQRAKVALDNALPLLDKLSPLRADFDPQEVEAVRAIVHTELIELVNELGMEGGPRVQRVDDLFDLLIDPLSPPRPTPRPRLGFITIDNGLNILDPANTPLLQELGSGEVGRLGDVFGLTRNRVNTIEEEQNLTDFVILRDYLDSLYVSWLTFRPSFLGQADNYFGTQLVWLQRALSVAAEQVSEVTFAMNSVFLGSAERQTVRIDFPTPTPPMFLEDLLSWVQTYAAEEGPRIIQDAGKRGARTIIPTLERLRDLVRNANFSGRIRHPSANHPRVRRTLTELETQLDQAARLAGTIR
jgi:hypothetical protein